MFLSAGEVGLADHMAEGQKRARTGQEVRMADIPADAGVGMGASEDLHGYASGAAFSKRITDQPKPCDGAPGRAWLERLTTNTDTLKGSIRAKSNALAAQMIPKDSSGQVERVGARFALVGVAGEMATSAGLTGWPRVKARGLLSPALMPGWPPVEATVTAKCWPCFERCGASLKPTAKAASPCGTGAQTTTPPRLCNVLACGAC